MGALQHPGWVFVLWLLWGALAAFSWFAGPWWDEAYNFWQATLPLTMLCAVVLLPAQRWSNVLIALLLAEIALNATDAFLILSAEVYNSNQSLLNTCQFLCMLQGTIGPMRKLAEFLLSLGRNTNEPIWHACAARLRSRRGG
jgi:hypothetical protein